MTDYIKREDAIEALGEEPYVWSDTDVEIAEHAQWVSDVKAIEAVPSADVVERKRGEWIRVTEELGESWMCSECMEEFIPHDGMEEFASYAHFCPNCGADMRRSDE